MMGEAKMTREEFLAEYGTVAVEFETYYKYSFTFCGELPSGETLCVDVGGVGEDIYKFRVTAGEKCLVSVLKPNYAAITKNGTHQMIYEGDSW
jgi:hypothetical protein